MLDLVLAHKAPSTDATFDWLLQFIIVAANPTTTLPSFFKDREDEGNV